MLDMKKQCYWVIRKDTGSFLAAFSNYPCAEKTSDFYSYNKDVTLRIPCHVVFVEGK
jgi:hypothetical protein